MAKRKSNPAVVAARYALPLVILAIGVGGLVALRSLKATPKKPPREIGLPQVVVAPLAEHESGLDIVVDGTVVPYREITVAAQVGGRVVAKTEACNEGKYVRGPQGGDSRSASGETGSNRPGAAAASDPASRFSSANDSSRPAASLGPATGSSKAASASQRGELGTLLVKIDPTDYDLEIRRLNAELKQAQETLTETVEDLKSSESLVKLADEELGIAEAELRRLASISIDVATRTSRDKVRRAVVAAKLAKQRIARDLAVLEARKVRLEASIELAQAKLQRALVDKTRTEIRAPVSGVVIKDHVEKGGYVQPGAQIVTIEDTSKAEVRCSLRLEELYWLWAQEGEGGSSQPDAAAAYRFPEADCTVSLEVQGRRFTWKGRVARYDGIGLDEKTRTVPCRVIVDDPRDVRVSGAAQPRGAKPPALVRGMFVSVRIHAKPDRRLVSAPEKAVRPGGVIWLARGAEKNTQYVHARALAAAALPEWTLPPPVETTLEKLRVNVAQVAPRYVVLTAAAQGLAPGQRLLLIQEGLQSKRTVGVERIDGETAYLRVAHPTLGEADVDRPTPAVKLLDQNAGRVVTAAVHHVEPRRAIFEAPKAVVSTGPRGDRVITSPLSVAAEGMSLAVQAEQTGGQSKASKQP